MFYFQRLCVKFFTLKRSWAGLQVPKCTLSLLASSNEVKTHSRSRMRIKGLRKQERTEIFVHTDSRQNWRSLCRMMVVGQLFCQDIWPVYSWQVRRYYSICLQYTAPSMCCSVCEQILLNVSFMYAVDHRM